MVIHGPWLSFPVSENVTEIVIMHVIASYNNNNLILLHVHTKNIIWLEMVWKQHWKLEILWKYFENSVKICRSWKMCGNNMEIMWN